MADDRQPPGKSSVSPSEPSGSDSFWKRSKRALGGKNFTFLQHVPKTSEDGPQGDQETEAKTAHTRRREQVRRAQRNHRERKERYIKTLEREVLRLRDEESTVAQTTKNMQEEIEILRELLSVHGIPYPHDRFAGVNSNATISVQQATGGGQSLHVNMPSPSFFRDQPEFHSPLSGAGYSGSETTPTAERQTSAPSKSQMEEKRLPSLPTEVPLYSSQTGIDFVLALEQPCLGHTRHEDPSLEGPSSGHALTAQALLLTHAPQTLTPQTSWQVPAVEIDRLLALSAGLNLVGEVAPVQAWSRIKSHPGLMSKQDAPQRLERLKYRLKSEVRCYAFGAVIDEYVFEAYLREAFD